MACRHQFAVSSNTRGKSAVTHSKVVYFLLKFTVRNQTVLFSLGLSTPKCIHRVTHTFIHQRMVAAMQGAANPAGSKLGLSVLPKDTLKD